MHKFVYAAKFSPDKRAGGYVVTFRDFPEAITQGDTVAACVEEAAGALQAALKARVMDNLDIPSPTATKRGEHLIAVEFDPK